MLMNIAKLENYLQIDSSRYNRPSIEALNYYATRFMLTVPFEILMFKIVSRYL